MFYVYIIKSNSQNWYYVGSTNNLEKRLHQHNNKEVFSTQARGPYSLFYFEKYEIEHDARMREKEIKSKRKLKEGIINNMALSSNG